ncbi:MAG TPA: hypothetical protein GXX67_10275 [Petrimonas sp.]|nr:hypothetical protein [Petrimonas sp.]
MRLCRIAYISLLVCLLLVGCVPPRPIELWYEEPAGEWLDALPIGNGRLDARVTGEWNKKGGVSVNIL